MHIERGEEMGLKKTAISVVLGGIVIFAVMSIIGMLVQMILPYDIFTLGGMRAMEDPTMMLFMLSPWVWALLMTIVYEQVKGCLKGTWMQKGQKFGMLVWLIGGLPSAFIVYTSMTYPMGFTVDSLIGSLLYLVAGSLVIAKFME